MAESKSGEFPLLINAGSEKPHKLRPSTLNRLGRVSEWPRSRILVVPVEGLPQFNTLNHLSCPTVADRPLNPKAYFHDCPTDFRLRNVSALLPKSGHDIHSSAQQLRARSGLTRMVFETQTESPLRGVSRFAASFLI